MSASLPQPVQNLIDTFARLPGIGPKMAARLTFHLLQKPATDINRFIAALDGITSGLQACAVCGNISDRPECSVCRQKDRNSAQICIVEGPLDVIAIEKTGLYQGYYHVLGGALSPIDGIGPDQLRFALLQHRIETRVEAGQATELIIATNPSLEGEATAAYVLRMSEPFIAKKLVTLSRIARGLPMGSDIEYADPTTLARALEGRHQL